MRVLIKKSILFSLVMIAGYFCFILLWGLFAPAGLKKNLVYKIGGKGHMYSRIQEVKKTKDVDILFIGSSLAARGFDPRVFAKHGFKTFNLASGGQTPMQSEWLLKKYLHQLNPKLIVFEVNPYVLSRDGVEPAIDLISNHDFEWSLTNMVVEINNIKVYNTFIYSLWCKILNLNENFNEPLVKSEDTYVHGGYIERKITFFNKEDLNEELNYSLKPSKDQKDAVLRIISFVNENKFKLILVQPPVTQIGFGHYVDEYRVEQFFSETGEYHNFNNKVQLNDTLHFFDSRHLNQKGVEVFNEEFIKIILKKAD